MYIILKVQNNNANSLEKKSNEEIFKKAFITVVRITMAAVT